MNKQQEELAMRLDLLMPMKWISDNYPNVEHIFSKMVALNQEWVKEVVNNLEHRLTDVLHDFKGIYAEDEHFLPRIQSEDILGDFDENGDAVDVKEHTFDEVWDNIIEYGIATEDELRLVCHINGNKIESLNDVLEVRTPYKDWSQYKSMEG